MENQKKRKIIASTDMRFAASGFAQEQRFANWEQAEEWLRSEGVDTSTGLELGGIRRYIINRETDDYSAKAYEEYEEEK